MIIKGFDVFKSQFSPTKEWNCKEVISFILSIIGLIFLIILILFIFADFYINNTDLSLSILFIFGAIYSNNTVDLSLSIVFIFIFFLLMILAYWLNRKYDHVKLFYEELDFKEIFKNVKLKNELADANINGIITVIENRNKKYVSTYKMAWTIATVLLFPTIRGLFDNIKDFNSLTLGCLCIFSTFFLSVICGIQMLYPLSRERQTLNAYLEYLIQINKNE